MFGMPDSTRIEVSGTFKVLVADNPCTYWSSKEHIVDKGRCRCGRWFEIMEVEK